MTKNLERKKINFIFDAETNLPEFRASNLLKTLNLFCNRNDSNRQAFIDCDTFTLPHDIIIHNVKGLDNFLVDFKSEHEKNQIWVFVLHWLKPYLSRNHMKPVVEYIHKMYDSFDNVHILADYGHESHIPGSMGDKFLEEFPFYDISKYVLTNISLENINVGSYNYTFDTPHRAKFKKIIPSFFYTTSIIAGAGKTSARERIKDRPHGSLLKNLPLASWVGKEDAEPNTLTDYRHRYLIPNRLGRKSRRELIVELDNRGLLDQVEWSMIHPNGNPEMPWDYDDEYKKRFGSHTKTMSRPYDLWGGEMGLIDPDQSIPYNLACNAICYVAMETYPTYYDQEDFEKPLNFPDDTNKPFTVLDASEKSIKPFIYGLVPFVYGRKGLVQRWRDLGMWLPGDYGNEDDHMDRMHAMIDAMEKFCNEELPLTEDICKKIKNNQDLILSLEFNYKLSKDVFEAFF